MRMRNFSLIAVIGLMLTLCCGTALADQDYTIRLVNGDISPSADVNVLSALTERTTAFPIHCLVQLTAIPSDFERSVLTAVGITLLEPIPDRAWLASISRPISASQLEAVGVRWGAELTAFDKMHPRVKAKEFGPWAQYESGRVVISVRLYPDVSSEKGPEIAAVFAAEAGDYIRSVNTWIMAVEPAMIEAIAGMDEVEWVDVIPPPLTPMNDVARTVVGANTVQAAPYGLDGSGITVCVYDGGMVDAAHTDFSGRITLGETGATADHPTHVAGSVGGSGALSGGSYRGMAPGCNLVSYQYEACDPYCLYNSPQDIEANYTSARNTHSADIATNSIGSNTAANGYDCAWEGDYELVSQLLDNIVRGSLGNPFTVLFAAGNERGYGTCGTTYSTMGVPGCAKNVITVGATDDADAMTNFSSWGPTDDGRVKPEVCAPGSSIYSTLPGNSYGSMSGTSMATPITSGCTALMLEQFNLSYPGLTPLPSTLKALLINTAVDRGNTGPDYVYGYGRIDIQAAVDAVIAGKFLEDQLATGETDLIAFEVPASTPSLRVSLAWMDPAATPLANPTLVNDLDIALISPSSTNYYPYVLNPASPSATAGTGVNHRDNTEQIVVANPTAGTWSIRVNATSLPSGPQTYSLAASISILPGYGTVSGIVTDLTTGLPVSGALVRNAFGMQQYTTGVDGFYSLYMPAGSVTIECTAFGYVDYSQTVTVPEDETLTHPIALVQTPRAFLSGYIFDQTGAPIAGAEIRAVNTSISPVFSAADGSYTMQMPTGETYVIRASATGYGAVRDTILFTAAMVRNYYLLSAITCYNFESDQGWTVGATGDNATAGVWGRMDPVATYNNSNVNIQPGDDHTAGAGVICYVTDGRSGTSVGTYDVDGGKTTLLSPIWDLSSYTQVQLDLWTWYSNDGGDNPSSDYFVVDVTSNGGTSWINILNTTSDWEYWKNDNFPLENYITLTNQVRIRIIAQDLTPGSLVEAAVDDICLYGAVPHAPDAPSSLVILAAGSGIHLAWQPVTGATSYRIERAQDFDGAFAPLDSVSAGVTEYLHVNGADSTRAFYRIVAKN